jgi:hypothetical protein
MHAAKAITLAAERTHECTCTFRHATGVRESLDVLTASR